MRIIFFGSDDFATKNLEQLIQSGYEVVACVTQPDRAKGRGMKVEASPIKTKAQQHTLPVLQPLDLKDPSLEAQLKAYSADVFVVIAYGRILPTSILDIPRRCAINVHSSLLPKYRGAAPVNWAIINGEKETGVSIIKVSEKLDAGDVFAQVKMKIEEDDTAITLKERMAGIGASCLCETIDALKENTHTLTPQDAAAVTYAPKLTKQVGLISWEKSAKEIHNLVRGLLPWPSAYTYLNGKLLKILDTEIIAREGLHGQAGELMEISAEGFVIAAGDGLLLVKTVHLESSKAMSAKNFSIGHKIYVGYNFSENT